VANDLVDTEFEKGFAWDDHLSRGPSEELTRDILKYKLKDGMNLFLTCESYEDGEDYSHAEMRVG